MRFGFFSDLHGDLMALERALEALQDADALIFLGDAVGGAQDAVCLQRLRELKIPSICGNHDLDPTEVSPLPRETQEYLSSLPEVISREGFLGVHSLFERRGAYRSYRYIYDENDAQALLDEYPDRLLFIGHTHLAALHWHHTGRDLQRPELSATFSLVPEGRYVCNVGMTRTSVVLYDTEADTLEFRLFELPFDRIGLARRQTTQIRPDFDLDVDVSGGVPTPVRRPWCLADRVVLQEGPDASDSAGCG